MRLLVARVIAVGVLVMTVSVGVFFFGDFFSALALWVVGLLIVTAGMLLVPFMPPAPLSPASADPIPTLPPPVGPPLRPPEPVWRYRPAVRELTCSGCGERILPGELTGQRDDRPEVFGEHCARTLSIADGLGVEGVGSEYVAGRITEERRDKMLDWLLRTEVM